MKKIVIAVVAVVLSTGIATEVLSSTSKETSVKSIAIVKENIAIGRKDIQSAD